MSLDCALAGGWISAAEAGTLDESDALRLEDHLGSCGACRSARTRLGALGPLLRRAPGPDLPSAAIDRAIHRAVAAPHGPSEAPRSKRARAPLGLAAVIAAAGILALLWPRSPAVHAPGEVVASVAETVRLAGVRVEAEAGARLRVERSSIVLRTGRVRVSVHPGTPFSVRTEQFTAIVAGTRFAVTESGVEVWAGRVVVRSRAGAVLADLRRGGQWRLVAERVAVSAPAALAPSASAAPAPAPRPRAIAAPRPSPSVADVRRALRERKTAEARELIDEMLGRTRVDRAELELLRADSLMAERRFADAARAYHGVADQFPRTRSGESALFTAAQIEMDRMPAAGRRSLEEYRRRYPGGTFATEVDVLLRRAP